jgi:hypothetical protein
MAAFPFSTQARSCLFGAGPLLDPFAIPLMATLHIRQGRQRDPKFMEKIVR